MQKQKKSKRINCLGRGRVRSRAESPRQRLSLLKHANYIGGASAVALGLLALALVSPNVTEGASAEEVTTALNIEMQPVVSVGIGKAVNLSFTPGSAGEFQNGSTKLTVSTNQIDGYQILMSTEGDSADITNIDAAGVIKSIVGSNITTSDFATNSWGYSINPAGETASSYNAVPNTVTQIKHVTTGEVTAGRADEYDLNFGAKVNNTLPAGNYNKLITISVVTNPIDVNNLQHLTYMQDMTHDICANTKDSNGNTNITPGNEVTNQLIDVRDGKKYWVSKLADQNCWMTQNLAYDITQERIDNNEINSSNTDLPEGAVWNNSSEYPPIPTVNIASEDAVVDLTGMNTPTSTASFGVGEFILALPRMNSLCTAYKPWLGACAYVGFYDVSDVTKWTPTYNAAADPANINKTGAEYKAIKCTEGNETIEENNGQMIVTTFCTAGEYDSHYLVGNYYQYNTGVAGSINKTENGLYRATESVCPKGWRLPDGGDPSDIGNTQKNSYYYLLNQYGLSTNLSNTINGTEFGMSIAPMYFVRGGNVIVYKGDDYLWAQGRTGYYETNTRDNNNQYIMMFHGKVQPEYKHGTVETGSIRCLAR